MYKAFYNLQETPFGVTANPKFFFMSKQHKEAYSHLTYGINERKGFLEITGEIGTGKTTLCRLLLNSLDKNTTRTAFILNPLLSGNQLLQAILDDFGVKSQAKNQLSMIKSLNKFLLDELVADRNVVLIIDESQNLSPKALEQVRLLSNLETESEKLIQIILVGQPELREKLDMPGLSQLRQRISIRYHLSPLPKGEIDSYVNHRLKMAGENVTVQFDRSAIEEIYRFSKGTPRVINMLCDKALLFGYVLETHTISADIVRKSLEEIEGKQTVS